MTTQTGGSAEGRSWSAGWGAVVAALPLLGVFVSGWLALRETPAVGVWIFVAFLLFGASPSIAGWASLRSRDARATLALGALVAVALIAITTWISLPQTSRPGVMIGPTVRGMGLVALLALPAGWWFAASRAAGRLRAGDLSAAFLVGVATLTAITVVGFIVAPFVPI